MVVTCLSPSNIEDERQMSLACAIGSDKPVTIDELTDKTVKITEKEITKTHDLSAP